MVYVVCWAALQYNDFLFNKPLLISVMSHVIPCHNPYQLLRGGFVSLIHLHNCTITACTCTITMNICSLQEPCLCLTPHYSLTIILTCHVLGIPFHHISESPKAQVLFMLPDLTMLIAKHPYVSCCSILSFFSILRIPLSYLLSTHLL